MFPRARAALVRGVRRRLDITDPTRREREMVWTTGVVAVSMEVEKERKEDVLMVILLLLVCFVFCVFKFI